MTKYSPLIAARALWQLRVRKRPIVLSHAINSICNMRCSFCEYWKEEGDEMSLDEIFHLLEEARSFGILVYNAWTVEPLLRKDLPQILEHAHSLGMITSLITNGKLLEERADDLKDLDYLSVSVDGLHSYKTIRGMDVDRILAGIRTVKDRLHNPLLMNCVISGQNLDDIEDLVYLADELNVRISFEPLYEFAGIGGDVWDNIGIRNMDKYHRTLDRVIEMKKEGYPIINSLTYLGMVRNLKPKFTCQASEMILDVTSDGTVENCRVHRKPVGNVRDGIANVWSSSRQRRKTISRTCEKCLFFGYVENSLMQDFNTEVMRHYEWM
ncbi:MAG: radical SAM protein [Methanosarcinaceae archaeon]